MAHLNAARHFTPDVDFIIDIGGQDMKCFKIRNGAVDSILLNEACSSGCGSFIETFAKALGYSIADFSKMGLFAKHPVNLGSRCTVFMNSSVKQAQKDGASVEDISAGLSISVVKNAIYKVIRAASADDLGKHIVVQGGTFLNDAVLRSFELEIGREVTRPTISGIMGAYGAALAAKELGLPKSALLSAKDLEEFTHEARPATCKLCTNHCSLTINRFNGGRRFISGNRCSRPLGQEKIDIPDLMKFKYQYLRSLQGKGGGNGSRGKHRHPLRAEHVREPALLVHPLYQPELRGGPLPRIHPEPVHQGAADHPLGHRLLPCQAPARPCHGSAGARAWTPSSTPACPTTSTRASGGQPLQLPRRRLLPRPAGGEHPRPVTRSSTSTPYLGIHRPEGL